ncbi:MAG: hypothetical protein V1933_06185 [Candidatus Omnitrophota bacterium]
MMNLLVYVTKHDHADNISQVMVPAAKAKVVSVCDNFVGTGLAPVRYL